MYVARDEDGHLWLYEKKPIKKPEYWVCVGGYFQVLNPDLFPEVKWEGESGPEIRWINGCYTYPDSWICFWMPVKSILKGVNHEFE